MQFLVLSLKGKGVFSHPSVFSFSLTGTWHCREPLVNQSNTLEMGIRIEGD